MKNDSPKGQKKIWKLKIPKIIKENLKAGFVPFVIILLAILICMLVIKTLSNLVGPIYRLFDQYLPGSKNSALDDIYLTIFSFLTVLLIWIGLGVIINALKNKRSGIIKIFSSLIIKLPFIKNLLVSEEIIEENSGSTKEKQVFVIRFKSVFGLDIIGYATNRIKTFHFNRNEWVDEYMVEVPNSPMPWSGYTHIVEAKNATEVWVVTIDEKTRIKKARKMTKAEAAKVIISCGLSAPSTQMCFPVDFSAAEVQRILSEFEKYRKERK